jgi:hypothetical protein
MTSLPISLGLLDPLAAGGHKIPEQMARPVHRGATQQQQSRASRPGAQRQSVPGAED